MHHLPTTNLLYLLLLLGTAATADYSNKPTPRSGLDESWASPAKETVAVTGHEVDQQLALGWSPRPTQAPKPLMGRMMVPRADDFTLGPQTCGFVPGTAGNYKASQGGACDLPSDYHTLCCGTASLPGCYTWVVSTSASSDDAVGPHTILVCAPRAGRGTLLTVDPGWSSTHKFGPTTTTSSRSSSTTSTSTTSTPAPTHKSSSSSSTPVAAIAGGTVGGVAALGLVGLAAFLFIRRRHRPEKAPPNATLGGNPPQSENPAAPGGGGGGGGGGGAVYPSGVPAGYAPVPMHQQGYDAQHMSQYGQQGGIYPQQYQGQYPPHQHHQHQQQYTYPVEVNGSTPGVFKEGDLSPQQHSPPPTELAATAAVGAETNRAELGN
ncbi:hypothetical protein A9Z42_0085900 [Trichoderma parareesei]|uniref:Epidermal growth factor receptor-like transmembrane-juxtamembrane segment domain-containing protein n=1 Tax=Trichoderma parareesei TaxID=858221 RepID=A0A2H3A702_TRIPA|nr:hypothetical protein A9Z42_0085900 [Trichoderma parareesei]